VHSDISHVQDLIRDYPDFPKQGILFKDINPVFRDGKSLDILGNHFYDQFQKVKVDYVAGIEARGFIISTLLGLKFNKGVIMIRKAGKLPGTTIKQSYGIEYGTAVMELQSGTALAAASLVEDLGGKVAGFAFIIELSSLDGGKLLRERGYRVHSMVVY